MSKDNIRKYIKFSIVVFFIIIIVFLIFLIILKYETEGENIEELPFVIEDISIVSTADGLKNTENSEYLWSGKLVQVNDVYIKLSKNSNSNEIIKTVNIDNIQILSFPIKGELMITRISKNEDTTNKYLDENINIIKYNGDQNTSLEDLTIANQGGIIGLRIINNGLGEYNSNEEEINYDGRILNIIGIKNEELKFKIAFDFSIETVKGMKYKTHIELELPNGDILSNGLEIIELDNIKNFIYKRY